MKKLNYINIQLALLLSILFFLLSGCDSIAIDNADQATATSSTMALNTYLDAYKKLRAETPNVLKKINQKDEDFSSLQDEYQQYEKIIKNLGYSGHPDFVKNNAKVGMIFSILQAFMKREIHETNEKNMDEMGAFIQEALNDPNLSEEQKVELREKLKEVNKGKQALDRFDQNGVWAKGVVKMARRLENISISEAEAMIVIKNEKAILEVYKGFPMPAAINIPHTNVDELE